VRHFRFATFLTVLAACQPQVGPAPSPVSLPHPETQPVEVPIEPLRPGAVARTAPMSLEHLIESLSTRDKVAQLVMPWIPGSYAAFDDEAFLKMRGWVDSLHVGGIIVSIGSPLDVAAKLNILQQRSRLPLLIGADLEGGTAFRLVGGTPFPTNMGVAAAGGELDAYQMGRVTALEGRAVGIHLAFAPVADVNNNPQNPIINTRSFGEDPQMVARLVSAAIRGIQEHGMLATAKHFPGHGDTDTDSHIALPVITAGWPRLDSVELVPFRAAIKAGVAVIMSAHIALPGIDSGRTRPATLTPSILTGVLRDSLGFRGLTVTDALGMGGIVSSYGGGEAGVLAFLAGADILLQPADPAAAIDALVAAVESGRVPMIRLDTSLRKILAIKRDLGLFRRRTVPLDSIPYLVGSRELQATARDVSQRAIVLVRDSLGTIDSLRRHPRSVTLVTYGDENSPNVGTVLANELRTAGYGVSVFKLWPASGPASYDSARTLLARNGVALFGAAVRTSAWRGTITLPEAMASLIDSTARQRPTVLVSLGTPYLLAQTPAVGSYLLAWASNALTEQAAARALTGQAGISGHLPISLPPAYRPGHGLQRPGP
jgi:beta-N-acetylhexosaminidase